MPEILVKHFTGVLTSENMQNPDWFKNWFQVVASLEQQGKCLVVFNVPTAKYGELVGLLESVLQERLK